MPAKKKVIKKKAVAATKKKATRATKKAPVKRTKASSTPSMKTRPRKVTRKDVYKSIIKPNLPLIKGWAMDGLTDIEIAARLGIHVSTYYRHKAKEEEFCEALKLTKEYADHEVEQALYKKALGYEYEENTLFNEKQNDGSTKAQVRKVKKKAAPDTTAMIFWLKNRQPKKWRDKQEINLDANINQNTEVTIKELPKIKSRIAQLLKSREKLVKSKKAK